MFSFIYMYTYLWTHILGYFILTRRNQLPFPVTESLKKHQEVWKWWLYSNQTFPGRIFLLFQLKSGTAHKTDSHCRNLPLSQNCNFPSLPKLDCALGYPVWWHPPPTCNPTHFLIVHTTLAVDISETLWMPRAPGIQEANAGHPAKAAGSTGSMTHIWQDRQRATTGSCSLTALFLPLPLWLTPGILINRSIPRLQAPMPSEAQSPTVPPQWENHIFCAVFCRDTCLICAV